MLSNHAVGAPAFARGKEESWRPSDTSTDPVSVPCSVFCVLEVAHELVRTGRQATQRDVYYKASQEDSCLLIFRLPNDPTDGPPVRRAVHHLSSNDLRCSPRRPTCMRPSRTWCRCFECRAACWVSAAHPGRRPESGGNRGIVHSALSCLSTPTVSSLAARRRGSVSGKIYIKDGPMNPWQDCTSTGEMGRQVASPYINLIGLTIRPGMAGRSIPGNIPAIEALQVRCSARYLLVIEKDAIFQALTQDRLFDELPCVMVTAKVGCLLRPTAPRSQTLDSEAITTPCHC